MQNMKKLFALMLMMASVFFISCDEDTNSELTTEEVKTELTNLNTEMSGYLEEMANSDGMEAMDILMAMPTPFTDEKSVSITSVIPNIKNYLLPVKPEKIKSADEEPFFFDDWVGTYTWNIEDEKWVPEFGVPTDKIILHFPTEGSTTNDAKITIHNYNEIEITAYDDEYQEYYTDYYPTEILADLYVNEIKIIEIDVEATWVTEGDGAGEPSSLDLSVYLSPFTFTGNFDHTSSAASIDFAIKYNDERIFSAGVNATFENDDMDDPLTVGGYIQLLNVKVEANADIKGLETIFTGLEEETFVFTTLDEIADAINEEIDAVVIIDGVKVADIEIADINLNALVEKEGLPFDVVFVYLDGTTESALPYFEGFVTDIEDFFSFLDDSYGD